MVQGGRNWSARRQREPYVDEGAEATPDRPRAARGGSGRMEHVAVEVGRAQAQQRARAGVSEDFELLDPERAGAGIEVRDVELVSQVRLAVGSRKGDGFDRSAHFDGSGGRLAVSGRGADRRHQDGGVDTSGGE